MQLDCFDFDMPEKSSRLTLNLRNKLFAANSPHHLASSPAIWRGGSLSFSLITDISLSISMERDVRLGRTE